MKALGYIGNYTYASLETRHEVLFNENQCNSSTIALRQIQAVAGRPLRFIRGGVRNQDHLNWALEDTTGAANHFAAFKSVGESCKRPQDYFDNNVVGTISLLLGMRRAGVRNLVMR